MTMPTIITPMSVMEEFKEELAEAGAIIAAQKNTIKEKDNIIKNNALNLEQKDNTINNLKAEIELLKKQLAEKNS